ncbi:MAG: molybdate ABC transporter substrate-binding protein [Nitrospirales bacterium]|nr:molybdate ABC transporter substrate-binding protein [Nitrospirales bacterium]
MFLRVSILVLIGFLCICVTTATAEEARVAVAANFLSTLNEIVMNFEKDTGHTVVVSAGSSGKLYAQVKNGAPFDVFFSADVKRPKLMEEEGLAVKGSRFTYAVGRLTLWSSDPDMIKEDGKAVLENGKFEHLAIANPVTAPYGAAAKKTLESLNLWDRVKDRIVQGENIGQTFQFVFSKNAQLGFVALSQILDPKIHGSGSRWDVPAAFHDPLEQEAVLLMTGQNQTAAKAFLEYVKGDTSRAIIERFGYGLP